MKKGLLVTVVLLAVALVFAGSALAAEITTSGRIDFKITGTDEEGAASGLFAAGDVYVDYEVVATSGDWEINVSPEFDLTVPELAECDSYIKYKGEGMSLTLDPLGIDGELYDLYSVEEGDAPDIPSNPGIGLDLDMEPLALNLVINNQAVGDEVKYNFGAEVSYSVSPLTINAKMGNTSIETDTWYGCFYGVKLAADMAPIALTGEYGSFSPETSGLEDGSGYYAELGYDLPEGGGSLGVAYTGSDEAFNGAGTKTADKYSCVEGWYEYPITDAVKLKFDVASEDTGLAGAESVTTYYARIRASL